MTSRTRCMGIGDLIIGLVARVSQKLHEEGGRESAYISEQHLSNILHSLQRQEQFYNDLQDIDFHRVGHNSFARVVESTLYGLNAYTPNHETDMIYMDKDTAKKRLARLSDAYKDVPDVFLRLDELADAFLKELRQSRKHLPNGS